jgi:alpha-L-fucosidase 2
MYRHFTSAFIGLALTAAIWGVVDSAVVLAQSTTSGNPGSTQKNPMTLWWKTPAPQWDQAMPVGNGRLGAMVFGQTAKERIQLNEDTLWAGGKRQTDNPEAFKHLPQVRKLLFEGHPVEAMDLADKYLMGNPKTLLPYQSLGDLILTFPGHENASEYRRSLDLDAAIARTTYKVGDAVYTREIFSSSPDQVLAIRISCSRPGAVTFVASLNRSQDAKVLVGKAGRLLMNGQLSGGQGLRFAAELQALPEGGTLNTTPEGIEIKDANAVTLLLAASTSFLGLDPQAQCESQLISASKKPYYRLRDDHMQDYRTWFRRMYMNLGESDFVELPTDERLARVQKGEKDEQLMAQFYQFGRYMLISSSRPGTMPANLQGIWADGMNPPWNSDYHLNINLQMNYWMAEPANLSECAMPLFDLLDSLREPGRQTAKIQYGCRGFVAHHITDLYGFTSPGDGPQYGLWPMGAAWLCQHLWEHYAFSGDLDFLEARAYPVMKEAAEFFLDYLTPDSKGRLVTGPSISPENSYRLPNGQTGVLCMGPSMDTQILHDLFSHCIQASKLLKKDSIFRNQLRDTLKKLPQPQIGKYGQLMEWSEDYEEPEPGHRHMSHLFALHPGSQISIRKTPELAQAAKKVLERRLQNGGGHTGWSRAWIINFWARLEEAELAYQNLTALLQKSIGPNLFDMHPPFQIDGNFGAAAGIVEMLLQSHADEVHLLPALPQAWAKGQAMGLRARGGYYVNVAWDKHAIEAAQIYSINEGVCRVRAAGQLAVTSNGKPVKTKQLADGAFEFKTRAAQIFVLTPNPASKK